MRGLVAQAEGPRLVGRLLPQPVEGKVGHHRRVVTRICLAACPVNVPFCAKVLPLAPVRHEPVEARAWRVVLFAHVPFANIGGAVTCLAQLAGPVRQRGGQLGEVVPHAVAVGVESRQQAGATGRAERGGAERLAEQRTPAGQGIDLRRADVRRAIATERGGAEVIADDVQHIRPLGPREPRQRPEGRKCQPQAAHHAAECSPGAGPLEDVMEQSRHGGMNSHAEPEGGLLDGDDSGRRGLAAGLTRIVPDGVGRVKRPD